MIRPANDATSAITLINLLGCPHLYLWLTMTNSRDKSATIRPWPFLPSGVAVAAIVREVVQQHRLVGLSLVTAVLALAPAANASPPDQSWFPGLYDNADFDDVILLITCSPGAIQPGLGWSLRSVASIVGLVTPMDSEPRPLCPLSSALSRAPPLA